MEHPAVRSLLFTVGILGLCIFLFPLSFRIVNIGNVFGAAVSALLLCYALLQKPIHRFFSYLWDFRAGRIGLRALAAIVILGVLYCLTVSCLMFRAAHQKPKEPPAAVIVLGCKVRGTVPSLMLSRRIHAAYAALQEYPEAVAVVSGGKGSNEDISEAQCMANELIKMGISADRILLEDRSVSTSENLRFSKQILKNNGISGEILIATDGYHELRAQMLAHYEGLDGCKAASAKTSWYLFPTYCVREWFGIAHAVVFKS